MSNITKLEFSALDTTGSTYISWVVDIELHLASMGLEDSIKEENQLSLQDRAKALIFLRHHVHEELKTEYITVRDPKILWQNLKDRFDHHRTISLPIARNEWSHLRFPDFKLVAEYNSKLKKITSTLELCGHPVTDGEKIEKTLSTFSPVNLTFHDQVRERQFQKYSDLNELMCNAEINRQLLMSNADKRPLGSAPVPEAHALPEAHTSSYRGRGKWNGPKRGRGSRRGRYNNHKSGGPHRDKSCHKGSSSTTYHQKWDDSETKKDKGKGAGNTHYRKAGGDTCHRCGMEGHWSRTCRTAKHLVDLYQASKTDKGKNVEMNFVNQNEPKDSSPFSIDDFLVEQDYNLNFFGDGGCPTN